MIVGIHKHSQATALLDERGGEVATFTFTNSRQGYQRCWLGSQSTTPPTPWSALRARAATRAAWSPLSRRRATRPCRCLPGAPTASAIARDRENRPGGRDLDRPGGAAQAL